MKYLGSKRKIAKHLLPIMLAERQPGQVWVEPFVGGANLIDKVDGPRIGNDSNHYLIALLSAIRDGYEPPAEISRERYYEIRANQDAYPPELVAFLGICCSFGGVWFTSYARDKRGRNYALEGRNSLLKQAKNLQGVEFRSGCYLDLVVPEKSLIYCDPPYFSLSREKFCRDQRRSFDSLEFWAWARRQATLGHTVYVSEYTAPDDIPCVLELQHQSILNRCRRITRIEKLYRL